MVTGPVHDAEEDEEDPDSECRYKCGFTQCHADCCVVLDHEESAHGRPWEVHEVCA